MHIAGIAAEYDPFHNGHELHIRKTREILGHDCGIVCAMSGSFTQRGEPACLPKHVRAHAALICGADLVLEIPAAHALSSAEGFAFAAASIFESLGCVDRISFGSESGDIGKLQAAAQALSSPELGALLREEMTRGISYAAAVQKAAERLSGKDLSVLASPNNLLGVQYIKALIRLKSYILPVTVTREGAGHDAFSADRAYPSASALRAKLRRGQSIAGYVPAAAEELYSDAVKAGRAPVSADALEIAVLSRLRSMSREEFAALPDSTEGLGQRLMNIARKASSLEELYAEVKTKRYAMSRIRRMVMCAFLGISVDIKREKPLYARVLACGPGGREILRRIDKDFPVITKPAAAKKLSGAALGDFLMEVRATDLWVLGRPERSARAGGEEWTTGPVIL